jgi:hypothetical protein
MRLGYLEQREFTLSNVSAAVVVNVLHDETFEAMSCFDFNDFARFDTVTTNRVRVIGIPVMVKACDERIRELDAVPRVGSEPGR